MDVGTVELTELEKLEVTRVDAVGRPANGFPALIMKGIAPPVAKGSRDCPKCDKSYDADHKGSTCENCGATLPDGDASKAADGKADGGKVDCPTCKGDGKIMGNKRDCPDCGATGKVTPGKAKSLAAKSLARVILGDLRAGVGKAVGADGAVDEKPDIDKGNQILAMLGEAIAAEAQEMAAGQAGEADDIMELACAAQAVRCWRDGEQAVSLGDVMPASMLMQSAAKADMSTSSINDLPDSAFAYIEPGGEKDSEGKTTPRSKRHFPVHDKAHADNAAARIAQGAEFGDKAKAKVEAAQRKFGEDTSKSQLAQEGTSVDTVVKGSDIEKMIADAVTKATAASEDRFKAVEAELAKVKATPVPGGPAQSVPPRKREEDGDLEHAAKAVYYDEWAERISDPHVADEYRKLAARERAKITVS